MRSRKCARRACICPRQLCACSPLAGAVAVPFAVCAKIIPVARAPSPATFIRVFFIRIASYLIERARRSNGRKDLSLTLFYEQSGARIIKVMRTNWRPAALSLTVLGAISRLMPHPPNFTAVGASSIFAGARLPAWQAYLVPLVLMGITDPIINASYGLPAYSAGRVWIYFSLLVSVWIGRRLRATEDVGRIAAAVFAGALQFFAI